MLFRMGTCVGFIIYNTVKGLFNLCRAAAGTSFVRVTEKPAG